MVQRCSLAGLLAQHGRHLSRKQTTVVTEITIGRSQGHEQKVMPTTATTRKAHGSTGGCTIESQAAALPVSVLKHVRMNAPT